MPTATLPIISVSPAKRITQHLGILDLLRGFAALSVVLFHFTNGALPKLQFLPLSHLFSWGYMGVEVFFVISGFVIPYSLWHTKYSLTDFAPYLRKRILRICPPAYVSLLLLVLQWVVVDYLIQHNHVRLQALSWFQILDNLTFLAPFTGNAWLNGVFWTLAIEFQFYLIVGLLYKLLYRTNTVVFLGLALLLHSAQYLPGLPTDNFFRFSLFFALGGTALLHRQHIMFTRHFLLVIILFTSILALQFGLYPALFGLATTLLIAFTKAQHSVFKWLGSISYSLYLTHFITGSAAEFLLVRFLHPHNGMMQTLSIAICVLTSIAGAHIFHRFVEQPFQKLSRRLVQ
jgi:peptidoglycan/LPS O-acetylase OafA/YrhL